MWVGWGGRGLSPAGKGKDIQGRQGVEQGRQGVGWLGRKGGCHLLGKGKNHKDGKVWIKDGKMWIARCWGQWGSAGDSRRGPCSLLFARTRTARCGWAGALGRRWPIGAGKEQKGPSLYGQEWQDVGWLGPWVCRWGGLAERGTNKRGPGSTLRLAFSASPLLLPPLLLPTISSRTCLAWHLTQLLLPQTFAILPGLISPPFPPAPCCCPPRLNISTAHFFAFVGSGDNKGPNLTP